LFRREVSEGQILGTESKCAARVVEQKRSGGEKYKGRGGVMERKRLSGSQWGRGKVEKIVDRELGKKQELEKEGGKTPILGGGREIWTEHRRGLTKGWGSRKTAGKGKRPERKKTAKCPDSNMDEDVGQGGYVGRWGKKNERQKINAGKLNPEDQKNRVWGASRHSGRLLL